MKTILQIILNGVIATIICLPVILLILCVVLFIQIITWILKGIIFIVTIGERI